MATGEDATAGEGPAEVPRRVVEKHDKKVVRVLSQYLALTDPEAPAPPRAADARDRLLTFAETPASHLPMRRAVLDSVDNALIDWSEGAPGADPPRKVRERYHRAVLAMEAQLHDAERALRARVALVDRTLQIIFPRASLVNTGAIAALLVAGATETSFDAVLPWVVLFLVVIVGISLGEQAQVEKNGKMEQRAVQFGAFSRELGEIRREMAALIAEETREGVAR